MIYYAETKALTIEHKLNNDGKQEELKDDGVTNFRKYKLNVLQSESDRNCNKKARSIRPDLTLQLTFAS